MLWPTTADNAASAANSTDAVWRHLEKLPTEGDAGYPAQRINDCLQPLWVETDHVAQRNMGAANCKLHGWSSWPSGKPRRVFDMFIFNKEVDMMEARLAELSPFVDVFVVVEAGRTHQGLPKPSNLKPHWKARFARFAHKVVHVWVDFDFSCPVWPWVCENYQREKLLDGFLRAGGQPNDVVIISDVDEVPRPEIVHRLRSCDYESAASTQKPTRLTLAASHFWYSAHCLRTDKPWLLGPMVASGRSLLRWGANQLRQRADKSYMQWGPPGRAKVDRGNTYASWADLAKMLPAGAVRDAAKTEYEAGTLTTRTYMPYVERVGSPHTSTQLISRIQRLELLRPDDITEQTVPDAAWHYSYFMTPQQIAIKYREANVGKKGMDMPPAWHYKQAMRCGAPQHPKWRFRYVENLTEAEVPQFVLRNRCRMRLFFRYARQPGAWLSNDYELGANAGGRRGGRRRGGARASAP